MRTKVWRLANLGCNVRYGGNGNTAHAMEASISGLCSFRLLFNQTWGCKNMLVSLVKCDIVRGCHEKTYITHAYKQSTPKETTPWIIRVVSILSIQENGPLVPADQHLAAPEVFFSPEVQMSC